MIFRTSMALAMALAVGAAASAQDAPKKKLTQMFISPMGEPFRAAADEPYPVEQWFAQADADHDGIVTKAEFRADALRFFKTLDADGDGVLEGEEIKNYENHIAPEITADILLTDAQREAGGKKETYDDMRGPNGEAPQVMLGANGGTRIDKNRLAQRGDATLLINSRRGAGKYGFLEDPDPVHGCDANIDFRVSLREWMDAADRRFERVDLKHTGKLAHDALPLTPIQQLTAYYKKKFG